MVTRRPPDPEMESFAGLLLRHRGRTGLTQRDLAARLGTTRRSVQDWESSAYYPSAERLLALIRALLESGGLTDGREGAEARAMWAAVLRRAPRMQTPLDEVWLDGVLAERAAPRTERTRTVNAAEAVAVERSQDWGEAPDVIGFVGRAEELAMLRRWVVDDHCRLAAVLGIGGIGKTALASRLAQDAAPSFQRVYWRSLRDALPAGEWMAGAIGFLSAHQTVPPEGESARRAVLLQLLRDRPCLLVLDNFETVLEPGQHEGRYRDGLASYGALLRAIGETRHQSCLVVTSREAPPELSVLDRGAARRFQLGGLGVPEGQVLLADKQLAGTDEDWADLITRFGGNGLAMKVVGESIRQVFDGDIAAFLQQAGTTSIFGGIRRLLAEQIGRSSLLEQDMLRVLAVEREPVTLTELMAAMGPHVRRAAVLEAVEGLRRRSLVERAESAGAAAFTLQSVVLEFVTERLVEDAADEIVHEQPVLLVEQPLVKAQAKDYVRQTQERLIGEPILQQLQAQLGADGAEQRLLGLLDGWRNRPPAEQGYGPGNVVNLLRLERGDLRGLDLTQLVLRQAYLAGVEAQDASLAGAHLAEAVLAEAFNYPNCVALSGDGASLAAGTSAGEVWLWRVADRTPLLALPAHSGFVVCVALNADGRLLVSGSWDGTVGLWDGRGGGLLASLQGHTGPVFGVALSADGGLLASGSWDGTIRLWETGSGRLLVTLPGHTGGVWSVALSADGRLLASGGLDGSVRLWEARSGWRDGGEPSAGRADSQAADTSPATGWRPLATLEGHTAGVRCVTLSADGGLLASGSEDATVRLWEPGSGRLLATLQGHTKVVRGVTLSADGQLLASSSEDGTVRLWEAGSGRLLATLQGHTTGVWSVVVSADGRLLASGGQDGTVRLWEVPSGRLLATLQGYTNGVWGVVLSANGRLLASGSEDETVRLWEVSTGRLIATLRGHNGWVIGLALSADERLLASGGLDGAVRLWDAPSGRLLATLQGHTSHVWGVALSADGRLLASGSEDRTARLWEAPNGRLLTVLQAHTGGVWSVTLSADGRLLASGSEDATIRLWESPGGRALATFEGHAGPVYGVALSADGRLLASGSQDRTVRLWETLSGQLLATLEGHTGGVRGVALSADGRRLASCSWDGTVRLWEAPSGRLLATLREHTSIVVGVTLSADGQLLASAGEDGTIRLWDASGGASLRTLRIDRRYERLDITGLTGVTAPQRHALLSLGAVDHPGQC
jgi:WD40 repeat protein/transcriptional regulator with XRE-family HTH domain